MGEAQPDEVAAQEERIFGPDSHLESDEAESSDTEEQLLQEQAAYEETYELQDDLLMQANLSQQHLQQLWQDCQQQKRGLQALKRLYHESQHFFQLLDTMQPQVRPEGASQQQEVRNEQLLQSLREQVKARQDILELHLEDFRQQLQTQQQQNQQHVGSHEEELGDEQQQQQQHLESAAVLEEEPFELYHTEEYDEAQLANIVRMIHTRAYDAAQEAFEMAGGPEHWPEAATQSYQTITRPEQPVFRRLAAAAGAATALADQLGAAHKAEHHVDYIVKLCLNRGCHGMSLRPRGPSGPLSSCTRSLAGKLCFSLRKWDRLNGRGSWRW